MKFGLCLALFLIASPCLAEQTAGVRHLSDTSETARPLALSVWYPSDQPASARIGGNAVFEGTAAAPDAPLPAGPLPLVVVSHGGLRSASDSGAWLSASLARAGFVAVEVNAPRPATAAIALAEIWRRPQDISRAVDRVLADGEWGARIDRARISVVGIALGATAALSVAGARLDGERYVNACSAEGVRAGPDCGWLAAQGVPLAATPRENLARLGRDPRVTSVVAVNPEYGAAIGAPPAEVATLLVTLGSPEDGPDPVGDPVALAEATVFDVFATCTAAGPDLLREDGGDAALCGTSPEVREAVHRQLSGRITSFLAGTGK